MSDETKHGIEHLQPALISAIKAGEKTFNTLKDGFQVWTDLMALVSVGTEVQTIFQNKTELIAEAVDVDTEEGQKLNAAVATEFGWTSEKAARKIKAGFNLLWAIIFFVDELNEPGDDADKK